MIKTLLYAVLHNTFLNQRECMIINSNKWKIMYSTEKVTFSATPSGYESNAHKISSQSCFRPFKIYTYQIFRYCLLDEIDKFLCPLGVLWWYKVPQIKA